MKKFFNFLVFFILLGGIILGVYYYFFLYNICNLPISVTFGNIDPRFKITQNEVEKVTNDATNRWNTQTGDNLFNQNSSNTIKINLIYDSRQEDLDKMNSRINILDSSRKNIENYKIEYDTLLSKYQDDLKNYNNKVAYWNSHGGAPSEEYAKLTQEKTQLDIRRDNLISMSQILNVNVSNYNDNLDNLKNNIDQRKNLIITQGEYDPNTKTIDIYTFGNEKELRLVLMHELGHGLNLFHATDKLSIMYELLDEQDLQNPTLTTEDKNLLSQKCNLNKSLFESLRRIVLAI